MQTAGSKSGWAQQAEMSSKCNAGSGGAIFFHASAGYNVLNENV